MTEGTFFSRQRHCLTFYCRQKPKTNVRKRNRYTHSFRLKNCIALLQQHYDCRIDRPLVHTYIPLHKSSFQFAWQHYRTEIEAFLSNHFRSNHDLNLATFLVPWLMFLNRKSTVGNEICYYFNIRSNKAPAQYIKLLENKKNGRQPHSFCANDFHSQQQIENYQDKLIQMLENYFKTK